MWWKWHRVISEPKPQGVLQLPPLLLRTRHGEHMPPRSPEDRGHFGNLNYGDSCAIKLCYWTSLNFMHKLYDFFKYISIKLLKKEALKADHVERCRPPRNPRQWNAARVISHQISQPKNFDWCTSIQIKFIFLNYCNLITPSLENCFKKYDLEAERKIRVKLC